MSERKLPSSADPTKSGQRFDSTRWSLVAAAGDAGAESPQAMQALNELCQTYWPPIYAEIRRRGHAPEDAKDLTQEFFSRLVRRQSFGNADQQKGRFRSFLLAALDHLLADQWRGQKALKRGAGITLLSIDTEEGENWCQQVPANNLDPAHQLDRRWALLLMERGLQTLREHYTETGRTALFEALKSFLAAEAGGEGYQKAVAETGMSETSFRVAVHRFRKRFRECVREQVTSTLADPAEADAEMRHLFGV